MLTTSSVVSSDYELIVRQEPKQARMCGVGSECYSHGYARVIEPVACATDDRRPIDPPPIVQLRVIDRGVADSVPSRSSSPDSGGTQVFVN
jgi:hypothetical protein